MRRRTLLLLALFFVIAVIALSKQGERSGRADDSGRNAPEQGMDSQAEPWIEQASGAAPTAPWRLVVGVRDASGSPTSASVFLTNEEGDLVERIDADAGEDVSFDITGIVGVRVIGEGDLAPASLEGLTAPPGSEKRLTITLERGLSIGGRVLEPTGELWLITSRVYAEPLDAPWNVVRGKGWEADSWGDGRWLTFDTGVGRDGSFDLSGLVPGRYRVSVSCDATERYCPRDEAQTVEAGTTGVRIHLVREACVKLRFVDSATRGPVTPGASWELTREDDREWRYGGGTDGAGEHRLWLRPGTKATLHVEADGYFPRGPVPIVAGSSGEETEVVCEFHPDPGVWANLDVLLRDEEGRPITDMVVWRETHREVTGNDQGLYELRVPAGSWRIRAHPDWEALWGLRTFWLPFSEEVRFARGERVRCEWTVKRGGLIVVRGDIEQEPWLSVDGRRIEDACWTRTPEGMEWSGGLPVPRPPKPPTYIAVVTAGAYRVETVCGGRRASVAVETRSGKVTEVAFPVGR